MAMRVFTAAVAEIVFPDSSWRLQITREDEIMVLSLYWSDEQLPTHQATCTLAEFDLMAEALGLAE